MSITFTGVGVITLPNPELGESTSLEARVNFRQSMNGTRYTYVKSTERRKFVYQFNDIDRSVAERFQTFFEDNVGQIIGVEDHKGVTRSVIFNTDSIDYTTDSRGALLSAHSERVSFSVEVVNA